ncbi:CMGC/MAPK protein kinase, variant 2 [Aphanomyces astaci]|uniref:Mitogen-activated protein kinase n=1 Tax=Aphanomyces astaci TaxID=112090 RepID=W4H4L6_APHAT|nr:CMGC/MAPK protein kinase, variant 2 [Aphanomyces astaci]ETV86541.1 CMGC/MAPK protein kinase, variant 2 [Aphanomyces astaci]|eukprot:XP_009823339.1 CMGC/MAPK protein kinase, variant 2 [Aphanomyces astaci]
MPPKSTKPAVATTNKRLHAIVTKPAAAPPALLKKRRTSLVRPDIVEVITPPKGFMDVAPTPHGPPSTMPPTPSFGATRFNQLPTPPEDSTMAPPAAGAKSAASYSSSGETSVSNRSTPSSPVKGEKQAGPPAAPSASSSSSSSNIKNSFRSWNVGTRYRLVRVLGKGSYGQVAEAYDTIGNKRVAIKKINNVFDQEVDCKRLYREIYILRHLRHPEVITLLDVLQPPSYATFNDLYLVFEFVDTDLHKLIMSPQYLTTRHIQVFLYQLLCALKYIHSANVIHRDMKPANILVNEDCTLKICDFGLARVVDEAILKENAHVEPVSPAFRNKKGGDNPHMPKFQRQLTKHVVTRWYRAPELILLQDYGYAVDLWSLGCIFAELLSMQVESCSQYQSRTPIFPGRSCFPLSADRPTTYSDKLDQLNVIFNVIGTPSEEDIGNLGEVKQYLRKLQRKDPMNLAQVYPGAPPEALDLLQQFLTFNPDRRITVRVLVKQLEGALNHPFLADIRLPAKEVVDMQPLDMEFENVPLNREKLKSRIFSEIQHFQARNAEIQAARCHQTMSSNRTARDLPPTMQH